MNMFVKDQQYMKCEELKKVNKETEALVKAYCKDPEHHQDYPDLIAKNCAILKDFK